MCSNTVPSEAEKLKVDEVRRKAREKKRKQRLNKDYKDKENKRNKIKYTENKSNQPGFMEKKRARSRIWMYNDRIKKRQQSMEQAAIMIEQEFKGMFLDMTGIQNKEQHFYELKDKLQDDVFILPSGEFPWTDKNCKKGDDDTISTADETVYSDNQLDCDNTHSLPKTKDSEDPFVMGFQVMNKENQPLKFDNSPEFREKIHKEREEKEADLQRKTSKKKVMAQCKKESNPNGKVVNPHVLLKLKQQLTQDDLDFTSQEIENFVSLIQRFMVMFDEMEQEGCVPKRTDWIKYGRDPIQIFFGSILSARCQDHRLFMAMMALRKMDLFDLETLASNDDKVRTLVEDVLLYSGFNLWTYGAARIIGAARRIKEHYNGEIPKDKAELLTFYGIGRKIMMLILQDALDEVDGLVVDSHLQKAFVRLEMTSKTNPDDIAAEVEAWLDKRHYRRVNEVFAGIRQLWQSVSDRNNKEKIFTLPRDTVLACGHGPLTTLAQEKQHNPFYAQ